jgi:predicted GNAT family N-acyltransferase
MKQYDFYNWECLIVGFDLDHRLISFCTLTKTDSIKINDYSVFIGYVFVNEDIRGNRISEKMLKFA